MTTNGLIFALAIVAVGVVASQNSSSLRGTAPAGGSNTTNESPAPYDVVVSSLLSEDNGSVNVSWHSGSVLGEGAEGSITAGATASSNMSLQAAAWGEFCSGKGEGQFCNSRTGYVYCSIGHNYMPWLNKDCSQFKGPMSWCKMIGSGLTKARCDDPFCRNGGCNQGQGTYCHRGNVVRCNQCGPHTEDTPQTIESCSDVTEACYQGRQITSHYSCAGGHNNAWCKYQGSTTSDC